VSAGFRANATALQQIQRIATVGGRGDGLQAAAPVSASGCLALWSPQHLRGVRPTPV